jgi:DNA-binding NtrC family response regulator
MKVNLCEILVVDDNPDVLTACGLLLKRHFEKVHLIEQPELISETLNKHNIGAVLLDMNFSPADSSGDEGLHWLEQILELKPQTSVVMLTAHGDTSLAVKAIKLGATDFVTKPWQNEKLLATLNSAVRLYQSIYQTENLKRTNNALTQLTHQHKQSIIGNSQPMLKVQSLIEQVAPTDANILILGNNGTGKELAARELHRLSNRSDKVFMSVDLGAISENLFESELFGHKKGAFTGANKDHTGRLEAANGGSLFLDEIGNIPLNLQAKLLTVLEQRQVTPLGSNQSFDINVRVIAATNRKTSELHDPKIFRQDLLFRLNTVEVILPDLKERKDDIPLLANYYIEYYCQKYYKTSKTLSSDAMKILQSYHWPGNIRSLRHAIERAVILSQGNILHSNDFQLNTIINNTQKKVIPENEELNLNTIERNTLEKALRKNRYNISHAAKDLGLTRAALYRRMEKHDL